MTLLLLSFALPAAVSLRSAARIAEIRDHAARTQALAEIQGRLQGRMVENASASLLANAYIVDAMRAALVELDASGLASEFEGERLDELRSLVARRSILPPEVILEGVLLMQRLEETETARQAVLLEDLRRDAAREVQLAAWGFLSMSALAALFLWIRVVRPLRGLGTLMTQVSEGRFEVASTRGVGPVVAPVFEHYNRLVVRLGELESAHQRRAETLEDSVRAASTALIEQHQALARSERLAAVGETAAGLAHELRNPLAGVVVSLGNLKRDVSDPEIVERLQVAAGEVGRAVRSLNEYLRSARHTPEFPLPVDVAELARNLVDLLRLQAPPGVVLEADVPDELSALLPPDRVRHVLMNLVLNAFQAMAGRPGHVRVSVAHIDPSIELRVEDDGPGFPAALLTSGVRPFVTGREGGTGLGLAVVRRTAQDLGGRLEIYNRPEGGAGACVTLPFQHA